MQFCKDHWIQLKDAIRRKGMGHLIARSGEELANRMKKEAAGELVISDPLIIAHNQISAHALEKSPYLMFLKEDGSHWCPLCDVRDKVGYKGDHEGVLDLNWIEGCTEGIKKNYIARGLISN